MGPDDNHGQTSAILLAHLFRSHKTVWFERKNYLPVDISRTLNIGQRTMCTSCKRNRGYRTREAIQVKSSVLWTWTRKRVVSHVHEQNKRSIGLHCQEMKQTSEAASHPIFFCVGPFAKGDLKCKEKSRQALHLQSTTQTKTIIIRTMLHALSYAGAPQCLIGLISTIEDKKLIVAKVSRTINTRAHESGTPKGSNSFGKPDA